MRGGRGTRPPSVPKVAMTPLSDADPARFGSVRFVLTDMDETLTYRGRLAARTYDALERLQSAGVAVIPVTAAPAGWCDQMARMWPVDGVIGENGGFLFRRSADGHGLRRDFWHDEAARSGIDVRLRAIAQEVRRAVPDAAFAEDQPFRLASLAFARTGDAGADAAILAALKAAGADATVNNLWVLGWLGGYDKLAMARRVLSVHYGLDVDAGRDAVLYVGDSTNDGPMFAFFDHTVGVSTVVDYLDELPRPPRWIAAGPGGAGFVEAADAVIRGRAA